MQGFSFFSCKEFNISIYESYSLLYYILQILSKKVGEENPRARAVVLSV